MKFPLKTAAGAVCLLAAIASPPLRAGQPASIDVAIETRLARYGSSFLHVVNNAREPYIIVFRAGPQSSIPIRFTRVELGPSAIADLDLGQLQFTGGVEVLDIVSTVSMGGEGEFAAGPSLLQVLKVGPSSVVPTTYEAAFLSKRRRVEGDSRPSPVDIGGGYMDVRPIGALSYESIPGTPDARAVPLDYPSVYAMSDMRPKQLPDFSAPPTGLARIAGQQEESLRGEAGGRMTAGAGPAAAAGPFGGMKGKFLLKVNGQYYGYSYLPAWGWSVRAWQQIGSVWLLIGATAANADGTWDLNFIAPPFPGFKVRIEYQPANRFVQVQDSNANVYTWGNSLDYTAPLTDVGTRNADLTNNGDAPGIDRIYQASSALWRRFNADGMNPVRDNPIEITFPNSSTDPCPQVDANNMPIPWSCSDSNNGKIWLIPKHAKAGVVQHELAHSIHSYYWDGNMPSGGGIQHKLNKCYNDGLALTEGFANFVAYWVQFERDNPGPVEAAFNYNIEKPPSNFCKASRNEGWVSAAFWDAYDTHDDGVAPISDTWNFFHHGAAVGTFLNNPGHNSMKEYWPVYISILGGNSFLTVFDSFSLNWILP